MSKNKNNTDAIKDDVLFNFWFNHRNSAAIQTA